jgi:hypothetical protein
VNSIGSWAIKRLTRSRRGASPKLAIALIVVLLALLFVLAPACFLAGLIIALVGHPFIGLVLFAASLFIGFGSLFAGVTTALAALRSAGEGAVFRLGRLQRPPGDYSAGEGATPEDLRRVDPDHDYIRGEYTRRDDEPPE